MPLARQPGDIVRSPSYLGDMAISSARNRAALLSSREIRSSVDGYSIRYRAPESLGSLDSPSNIVGPYPPVGAAHYGVRGSSIIRRGADGVPSLRTSSYGIRPVHPSENYHRRLLGHYPYYPYSRSYTYRNRSCYPYWGGSSLCVSVGYPAWSVGVSWGCAPSWYGHCGYYRYGNYPYWHPRTVGVSYCYPYYPCFPTTYVAYGCYDPYYGYGGFGTGFGAGFGGYYTGYSRRVTGGDASVLMAQPAEEVEEVVEEAPPETVFVEETAEARATVVPELEPESGEEQFFAKLQPAQLGVVLGMIHLRDGHYHVAAEAFYNASLQAPESRLAKVLVGTSLFTIGEFRYAASFLRSGLDGWERYPLYRWDLRRLYGQDGDYDEHLALLDRWLELRPRDLDGHLTRAFVLFSTGDELAAADSLDLLLSQDSDPQARSIARTLADEIVRRGAGGDREDLARVVAAAADPTGVFLSGLELSDVAAIEME